MTSAKIHTLEIHALLTGGTRRSLGRANEVASLIAARPEAFPSLFELMWDGDPVVRMRAADAAEKITVENKHLLQPHKRELLGLLYEAIQPELRWHLALMIPRVILTADELRRAVDALQHYLTDSSSIVKTCAMQGLADLARRHPRLRHRVLDQFRALMRTGTPAMKARGRKLLPQLGEKP